ncbi:hypothetical protein [Luteimicrobium subarcticum]|uniref:Htaa protein n=1 Tax=Luteimicrobium subarcticum TaxID=620910 RepID=A0A2M8WS78_9MICO|nr:hypothetical protein [Luteimicrobium subarcticum]PJI93734.1 hypothetical protein CLV34_1208 [Luteimicrobium subarcticum]
MRGTVRRTLAAVAAAALTATGLVAAGAGAASAQPRAATTVATHHSTSGHSTTQHPSRAMTGYTQVVVAPPVYQLVAGAGITPAPIGGAKAFAYKDTLAARFPITGYALSGLSIKHSGGISLTAGAATISLSDFSIDLARGKVSGVVNGSIGSVGRVDLFTIAGTNRLDLGLVRLKLTDTAAGALDSTFGVDAFSAGDTFGYATPRPFSRF